MQQQPKLTQIRPMLYTEQVKETIDFYVQQLGFTCDEYSEEVGWASMHRDQIEIMVAAPNGHIPFERPTFTGSLYINVESVDVLWGELKDKATIAYSIEAFDHGTKEFGIYDNNGYMLQFGQEIAE